MTTTVHQAQFIQNIGLTQAVDGKNRPMNVDPAARDASARHPFLFGPCARPASRLPETKPRRRLRGRKAVCRLGAMPQLDVRASLGAGDLGGPWRARG